jgi:hypothetical protein
LGDVLRRYFGVVGDLSARQVRQNRAFVARESLGRRIDRVRVDVVLRWKAVMLPQQAETEEGFLLLFEERRKAILVVALIEGHRRSDAPEVGQSGGLLGFHACPGQGRYQDRNEQRYNRNHNEQFD